MKAENHKICIRIYDITLNTDHEVANDCYDTNEDEVNDNDDNDNDDDDDDDDDDDKEVEKNGICLSSEIDLYFGNI